MKELEWYVIALIVLSLLVQSTVLFIDAKKKNSFAWFWGIWGLIQLPMPTVFYLLFVIVPHKRRQKRKEEREETWKL